MNFGNPIGLLTLIQRELVRTFTIINQVIWPPIITTLLYVFVFGLALGSRITAIHGVPYASYLIPGLIMLQVIDATYSECSSSFFQGRFMNSIQELLIAPLSALEIVTGYIVSALLRALVIAALVLAVGVIVVHAWPQDWGLFFVVIGLVATLFGALGLIVGMLAEKFDHIAILTTFVITPLTFVGGVFTSIRFLPPALQHATLLDPMFYMIDAFRHAFSGTGDEPLGLSLAIVAAMAAAAVAIALRMTYLGVKLRV
ncbi:MAG: ABC transporter permease [Vulcanimicrobiaceae bacterium]